MLANNARAFDALRKSLQQLLKRFRILEFHTHALSLPLPVRSSYPSNCSIHSSSDR